MPNPAVRSTSPGPARAPAPGHQPRRPVSRRVRLHRTVAGTLGLVVVGTAALLIARPFDDDPVPTAARSATHVTKPAAATPSTPAGAATASPTGTPSETASSDADGSSGPEGSAKPGAVVQRGSGKIRVVQVDGPQSSAGGAVVHYTVELEDGLGVDAHEVASTIRSVLLDPRGWQTKDRVRFVNVSPAEAARGAQVDVRITLASPATTDLLCAPLRTLSQVSCWSASRSRSVLNLRRWTLGDDSYGADVASYRVYQVNHEVGHGLGHGHQPCPGRGSRAPVMLQQTFTLGGCTAWPYPTGP